MKLSLQNKIYDRLVGGKTFSKPKREQGIASVSEFFVIRARRMSDDECEHYVKS